MPCQKRRTWTHTFCALAGMHCSIVPSQPELIALQQCGLGLRDITFDFDGDAVNVQATICRFIILDCKLFLYLIFTIQVESYTHFCTFIDH